MGNKKQEISGVEGNMAFTFLYKTYLDFVGEDGFDINMHSWIEKEYKTFRRKRANAIKGLDLNKEFSRVYPDIKRNTFHLDKIGQLNWELEKKLNERKEFFDYSNQVAVTINEKNKSGLIVKDIWDYVTPLLRGYSDFELKLRIRNNLALLNSESSKRYKKDEMIDKVLQFILVRKGAKNKFKSWLNNCE